MITVFVPCDAAAKSVGADEVAQAISAAPWSVSNNVKLVRNGSRGMFWLEPMVEVDVAGQRIAYGPVTPADVESLYAANFLQGGAHPLRLGVTAALAY
ncbi:MAG: hypothetical protein KBG15_22925, partial [Kofleriaceae bacterium]|nr:hypothetical protein [Kofleriaceae bacterium]